MVERAANPTLRANSIGEEGDLPVRRFVYFINKCTNNFFAALDYNLHKEETLYLSDFKAHNERTSNSPHDVKTTQIDFLKLYLVYIR